MCGLIALFTEAKHGFTNLEIKSFGEALYINALRGEDATGIVMVDNTGETQIIKDNISSCKMLCATEGKFILNRALAVGTALLGHNRKKTSGTSLETDAHPFIVDNRYVFMHNGTIINHHEIGKFSVDSESLANHVVEHSHDPVALAEVFSKVQGAYACIWLDTKTETVYWIRNLERPLNILTIPQGIALSSEADFMEVALNRNYIVVKSIEACKPNVLYSLKLGTTLEIKSEELIIKKARPPIMGANTTASMGKTKIMQTITSMIAAGVSKNKFKALRKRHLNKPIFFWFDEYIEGSMPNTLKEWLIFGTTDHFGDFDVSVNGIITAGSQEDLLEKWDGKFCSGIIEDMIYDPKKNTFDVTVKNIKIVPSSMH